jgi:hypothetical protein
MLSSPFHLYVVKYNLYCTEYTVLYCTGIRYRTVVLYLDVVPVVAFLHRPVHVQATGTVLVPSYFTGSSRVKILIATGSRSLYRYRRVQ